jgi:hypothetical protein
LLENLCFAAYLFITGLNSINTERCILKIG